MGKKAKLKQIRRIASQLPALNVKAIRSERLTGKEAMMEGINEVDGKPVNQNSVIRKKSVVSTPLNHNRKMKQLYNKYGIAGVAVYIDSVQKISKNKVAI